MRRERALAQADAGPGEPGGIGHRRHYRRGAVFAHGHRGGRIRRARGRPLVRSGGDRLRLCGHVLQRILHHDPDCRQRVHLRLRHHGRAAGLDYRLGPGAGVRRGRGDRFGELVELRDQAVAHAGHHIAGEPCQLPFRYDARHHQSARGDHHLPHVHPADRRHPGVGARQWSDCGGESSDRHHRDRGGIRVYQPRQLHSVHPA